MQNAQNEQFMKIFDHEINPLYGKHTSLSSIKLTPWQQQSEGGYISLEASMHAWPTSLCADN